MKKYLLLYGIMLWTVFFMNAQTSTVSGVINAYAMGVHVVSPNQICVDQITSFNLNDTVLIIQMQGAEVNLSNSVNFGNVANMANAGNFEFSVITAIDVVNKIVTLRCPLFNSYNDNLFQMVKVKSYIHATIVSDVTCQPWDGQKGGVVAMIVYGTLTMNANIDVSAKGFRGAVPTTPNTLAECSSIGDFTNYFYSINGYDSSGIKGEGIARLPLFYARGRGKIANGGGAGNSLNSAGGGGSNAGLGGNGGKESNACAPQLASVGGIGGQVLNLTPNKLFMGGGGGCGTFEVNISNATKGGNGGGIVIVIANSIVGNGKQIMANGETIVATATGNGSAGGGGAGGTIILNTAQINGTLSLIAKGGDGSSCSGTPCRGTGGGGGGGFICHSNNVNPIVDVTAGVTGSVEFMCSGQGFEGTNGQNGSILNNFILPLNCLLDPNIIQVNQTICYGTQPQDLTGTLSSSMISFQWQYSIDSTNWNNCGGTSDQSNFQPDILYQTTYFRRIVNYLGGNMSISNIVSITINPFSITVQGTDVNCFGQCTGTASVEANPSSNDYSFHWSNGGISSSLTGLCANVYSVTVTNIDGCTHTGTITINQPSSILSINLTKSDVTCHGLSNGSATATATGGSPGYSYLWSNGYMTQSINNIPAGNYIVTVTDHNDCTASQSISILQPSLLSVSISKSDVTCYGLSNGSATVTATGGTPNYSYLWSNDDTTQSINNIPAGNYAVTVTDHNGCTVSQSVSILQPSLLSVNISKSDVTCYGLSNGSATVTATGGTPNYSYLWSNDDTTQSILNLSQGTYIVTVHDAHNCNIISSVIINEPATLNLLLTIQPPSCSNICNGNIVVNTTGGTTPYSFNLSTTPLNNLCAGSYGITVTDAHNCIADTTVVLIPLTTIQNNNISIQAASVCPNSTLLLSGTEPTGSNVFSFLWQISSDNHSWNDAPPINNLVNYSWTVQQSSYFRRIAHGDGCSDTSNVLFLNMITIHNQISINDSILCVYDMADTIHGTSDTGYVYIWQFDDGTGWQTDINASDAYYISSGNIQNTFYRRIVQWVGCSDTSNIIHIYKLDSLITNKIMIDSTDTVKQYCETASGNIGGTVFGINDPYISHWQTSMDSVAWNNLPDTTSTIFFSLNNYAHYYYYRRIIEYSGCFDTSNTVMVDIISPINGNIISSNLGSSPVYVCPATSITLGSLSITGGTGSYSYQWEQSIDSLIWDDAVGIPYQSYFTTQSLFSSLHYIRIVISGVCVDTSNIFTVFVTPLPPNQITCNHSSFCQGSQLDTIYESQPTIVPALVYQWQWLNNGNWENISDTNNPYFIPPCTLGTVTYRRVINLNSCSSNSNEITITCYPQPTILYSLIENDSLCLGITSSVHLQVHLEGTAPWLISYSLNGIIHTFQQFQSDTLYPININQSYEQLYISQLSDLSGCAAIWNQDTIQIWGFSAVTAQTSNVDVCGLTASLQATPVTEGVGIWNLPTGITANNIHEPNAIVSSMEYGSYNLVWEVSNGPCMDTAQIVVVFYEQPQIPNAGNDIVLDEQGDVQLQATSPTSGMGTWSIVQGNAWFTNVHLYNTMASNFNEGQNILRWTVVNGVCPSVYDDVIVTLNTIQVPEGFSPNGDNVNDFLVIKGLDITKLYSLTVFNRWGNVVYEKIPYDNLWDGNDKNQKPLPDDTYFYMLKKNDKVYKNGYVVLKR